MSEQRDEGASLIDRLRAHRTLAQTPQAELEWLAARGAIERYAPGHLIARKGVAVEHLYIILKGHMTHFTDRGGAQRKVMEWREGDVTGRLPYSRMILSPGNTVVQEPAEVLCIPQAAVATMPVEVPQVTATLVHVMVDRAREFKISDLQTEKMASLGKVAAGLAHELNNPASAAAGSARLLAEALADSEEASRALGAAGLNEDELVVLERAGAVCGEGRTTSVLSPLERSDREETIADWLAKHGADETLAESLVDTDVSLQSLDALAAELPASKLKTALRWLAAGCAVRSLARDVERASSRVHKLVSAVKRFTYMDQAVAPEAVDIRGNIGDTLVVLGSKARGKSASVSIDIPEDLPRIRGVGGELNLIWSNLIDNALDAVGQGGHVSVTAHSEGQQVIVQVIDDGPGIPAELKNKIFELFYTTKPVGEGTGLGLETVQRLVDRNNGVIEVDSEPGRTEFRVTLPAV
jgi:signal transduction histidine kinase